LLPQLIFRLNEAWGSRLLAVRRIAWRHFLAAFCLRKFRGLSKAFK
jgi:hypothetical protein